MPRITQRATRPYSRDEAAEALMEELQRWRERLGYFLDDEGGNPYSPGRSWTSLRVAHREGRLFEAMTDWLAATRAYRTTARPHRWSRSSRPASGRGSTF